MCVPPSLLSSARLSLAGRSSMLQRRNKIREDAGRRHGRTGARTADDQRIVAIAARHELHDVVREADVRERMIRREALQSARPPLPARTSMSAT